MLENSEKSKEKIQALVKVAEEGRDKVDATIKQLEEEVENYREVARPKPKTLSCVDSNVARKIGIKKRLSGSKKIQRLSLKPKKQRSKPPRKEPKSNMSFQVSHKHTNPHIPLHSIFCL